MVLDGLQLWVLYMYIHIYNIITIVTSTVIWVMLRKKTFVTVITTIMTERICFLVPRTHYDVSGCHYTHYILLILWKKNSVRNVSILPCRIKKSQYNNNIIVRDNNNYYDYCNNEWNNYACIVKCPIGNRLFHPREITWFCFLSTP